MDDLHRAVGRLEGSIEGLKQQIDSVGSAQEAIKTDIKTLLEWRWKLFGSTAVIAVIVGTIFQILIAYIERGSR